MKFSLKLAGLVLDSNEVSSCSLHHSLVVHRDNTKCKHLELFHHKAISLANWIDVLVFLNTFQFITLFLIGFPRPKCSISGIPVLKGHAIL